MNALEIINDTAETHEVMFDENTENIICFSFLNCIMHHNADMQKAFRTHCVEFADSMKEELLDKHLK